MPLDAAGEDAKRTVDVARELESPAGDLPLDFSREEPLGTGRGLAGEDEWRCPDIECYRSRDLSSREIEGSILVLKLRVFWVTGIALSFSRFLAVATGMDHAR